MNETTIDKFVFGCYPFKKDKKEQVYGKQRTGERDCACG